MPKQLADTKNSQVTKETIEEYLFGNNIKLSEQQKKLFVAIATRFNLDPFKHEIYAIPYGNKFNIVIGYEAYIKRAELSGKLNGWNVKTNFDDRNNVIGATATIYRKDWAYPLVITIYKEEYKKDTSIWRTMPATMCEKIAISRAFKLAFPLDIEDLPESIADENSMVSVAEIESNISNVSTNSTSHTDNSNNLSDSDVDGLIECLGVPEKEKNQEKKDNDNVLIDNVNNNTSETAEKRTSIVNKALQLEILPEDFKKSLRKYYNKDNLMDLTDTELNDLISRLDAKLATVAAKTQGNVA